MSKEKQESDVVLENDLIDAIGASLSRETPDADRISRLRARVLHELDNASEPSSLFDTIRYGEGDWIEIAPLVAKKVLKVDSVSGIESYLLRMHPGATVAGHDHESDELCYVVEGDITFGDIHLEAGDYHFAYKGTRHGDASTANGALLFLQSGIEA